MPRKILLIEDNRMAFKVAEALFAHFLTDRYELDWAATYEEGIVKLLTGRYAACLLDFQLGDRDGLQLIREALALGCHTPIVFLTAEADDRVDLAAMEAGAADYLVKDEITPRLVERSLRYAVKMGDTLETLRSQARTDQLTGLLNRREFDRVLTEEVERAWRFDHPLSLIMVDIDHFKTINDTHGHPVGDAVLCEIARRIMAEVRTVDRVARVGGEEFGVLVMQSARDHALEMAERICARVRREPIRAGDSLMLRVTLSAGVAALPDDAGEGTGLVAAADRALYAAKAAGRDRVARPASATL